MKRQRKLIFNGYLLLFGLLLFMVMSKISSVDLADSTDTTWSTETSKAADLKSTPMGNIRHHRKSTEYQKPLHWTRLDDRSQFLIQMYQRMSSQVPEVSSNNQPRFVIQVFAWKRYASLKRLLDSLRAASYFGLQIDMNINIEGNATDAVVDCVSNFRWDHGTLLIRKMAERQGLEQMITKAWWPNSDDEYAIFLEDDIEVSPHYFEFLLLLMNRHVLSKGSSHEHSLDDNLVGISLYTPRWDEINNPPRFWIPSQRLPGSSLFLSQVPCSWGALYLPKPWREFIKYYRWRTQEGLNISNFLLVPNSRSNTWTRSWKRLLIEYMFVKGWYMIYPSFPKQVSLSTNHREPGAHTGIKGTEMEYDVYTLTSKRAWQYTVPLLYKYNILRSKVFQSQSDQPLSTLPVINIYHKKVPDRTSLLEGSLIAMETLFREPVKNEKLIRKLSYNGREHSEAFGYRGKCILDEITLTKEFRHSRADLNLSAFGIEGDLSETRFLLFQPQMGYNNQLRAIEDAFAFARILDRVLVIPPLRVIRKDTDKPLYLPIHHVFDIPDDVYEDFTPFLDASDFIELLDLKLIPRPQRQVFITGLTKFLEPNHDYVKEMGIFDEDDELVLDSMVGGRQQPALHQATDDRDVSQENRIVIHVPSINRNSQDVYRMYGGCQDTVLSFTTLFSAFGRFSSSRQEDQFRYNRLRDRIWRLAPWLQEIVDATMVQMKEADKTKKEDNFACIHVRRSDFKEYCKHLGEKYESMSWDQRQKSWLRDFEPSNCYPSIENITAYVLREWGPGGLSSNSSSSEKSHPSTIYISSDSPEELSTITNLFPSHMTVHFHTIVYRTLARNNFTFTNVKTGQHILPQISETHQLRISDFLPFIEQELCMRSAFFMGNYYSTYSRRIVKTRNGLGLPKDKSVFFGSIGKDTAHHD